MIGLMRRRIDEVMQESKEKTPESPTSFKSFTACLDQLEARMNRKIESSVEQMGTLVKSYI